MSLSLCPLRTSLIPNGPGEFVMPHAASVDLPNGTKWLPQHYLQYQQTPESIAEILSHIQYSTSMLLFCGTDPTNLYLQAGVIGRENYDRSNSIRPRKLVYGRKWRIETYTPTSEIIQTAFLAIKKAREHEVRELLTLRGSNSGKFSAPFSNHQDLPLMATNADLINIADGQANDTPESLQHFLEQVRFGHRRIEVTQFERRANQQILLDLKLSQPPLARMVEADMKEFDGMQLSLILNCCSGVELLYELMDTLIKQCDRLIDEQFEYKGQRRFSRENDPRRIAQLSRLTRPYARDQTNALFSRVFNAANYAVDAKRVPNIGLGKLAEINRSILQNHPTLNGHMPDAYMAK